MQDKGFGVLLAFENKRAFCWFSRARAFKNYQEVCIGLRKLPQVVCAPQFCVVAETAMSGGFHRNLSARTLFRKPKSFAQLLFRLPAKRDLKAIFLSQQLRLQPWKTASNEEGVAHCSRQPCPMFWLVFWPMFWTVF